ncbi:MAG: hypothetical protein WB760_26850 [Xanthobacteraceae bacterium]
MSSIYDPDDAGKALEHAARVKFSSNLDQVHHILLLHKLANAYLTVSARMLFAKFLDKSEEELNDESRAA